MITVKAMKNGKPDPERYRLGIDKCALGSHLVGRWEFLVLKDAPAGVSAGKRAGCRVPAIASTCEVEVLRGAGPD